VTSDPDLKITTYSEVEYLEKAHLRDSYYSTLMLETIPNLWNGTMFGHFE